MKATLGEENFKIQGHQMPQGNLEQKKNGIIRKTSDSQSWQFICANVGY